MSRGARVAAVLLAAIGPLCAGEAWHTLVESSCALVDGLHAHVAMDRLEAVVVGLRPRRNTLELAMRMRPGDSVVALSAVPRSVLQSILHLDCESGALQGLELQGMSEASREAHTWGTVVVAAPASTLASGDHASGLRSTAEWARVMHRTDDHMQGRRQRDERGTAAMGLVLVLPAHGRPYLGGCSLRARGADLVVLPRTAPRSQADHSDGHGRHDESSTPAEEVVVLAGAGAGASLNLTSVCESPDRDFATMLEPLAGAGPSPSATEMHDSMGAQPVSLLELRANSMAKFLPLLKEMLTPVINEAMNIFSNPIFNEMSPLMGEDMNEATQPRCVSVLTPRLLRIDPSLILSGCVCAAVLANKPREMKAPCCHSQSALKSQIWRRMPSRCDWRAPWQPL